jgi:hypothetical protein
MRATFTPEDWWQMAREIADALADLTLKAKSRVTDAEANTLLERAATRLCNLMLQERIPHQVIETTLDIMAQAYEARLRVLDAALVQDAGQAYRN